MTTKTFANVVSPIVFLSLIAVITYFQKRPWLPTTIFVVLTLIWLTFANYQSAKHQLTTIQKILIAALMFVNLVIYELLSGPFEIQSLVTYLFSLFLLAGLYYFDVKGGESKRKNQFIFLTLTFIFVGIILILTLPTKWATKLPLEGFLPFA
ncbi:MAG: hypothetical protein LBM27_06690, partial [Lactobacillaceae bacterium]|nr:hypothetical protein [Lactobacillaceae bacterium]